jgi:hypothetical protein
LTLSEVQTAVLTVSANKKQENPRDLDTSVGLFQRRHAEKGPAGDSESRWQTAPCLQPLESRPTLTVAEE